MDSRNPLDATGVHPESYEAAKALLNALGYEPTDLKRGGIPDIGRRAALFGPDKLAARLGIGLPTLSDMLAELQKPGRDPREAAQEFSFADDIHDIEDLKVGMELPGLVTNLTAFGAFVDIGLHENGLIHASQMGVRGMAVPSQVLKLHQHVKVQVLSVDLDRKRIGLRLISGRG
jgi:uncharacterized protein